MHINKASGLDTIPANLLKYSANYVSKSLTHIFNLSIDTGILPFDWKNARVSPIFKDDSKTDPTNYRPISVLPVTIKVLERAIFNQIYNYLIRNNILAKFQSGFRPLHSTVTALLDATNEWLLNIDNGLINAVLFLDLKKAFDTIDHEILLTKLNLYGFQSKALAWVANYLSNRTQKTQVQGVLSDCYTVKCGIQQGSILGR